MPVFASDRIAGFGAGQSTFAFPTPEKLTIVGINNINPLLTSPNSDVLFFMNGEIVDGITNDDVTITVNPAVLGVNVGLTDVVKAVYS